MKRLAPFLVCLVAIVLTSCVNHAMSESEWKRLSDERDIEVYGHPDGSDCATLHWEKIPWTGEFVQKRMVSYYCDELPHYGLLSHANAAGVDAQKTNPYPVDLKRGREAYESRCSYCHGRNGQGKFMWRDAGGAHYGPPLDVPAIRGEDAVPIGTLHYVVSTDAPGFNMVVNKSGHADDTWWDLAEFLRAGDWHQPQ